MPRDVFLASYACVWDWVRLLAIKNYLALTLSSRLFRFAPPLRAAVRTDPPSPYDTFPHTASRHCACRHSSVTLFVSPQLFTGVCVPVLM